MKDASDLLRKALLETDDFQTLGVNEIQSVEGCNFEEFFKKLLSTKFFKNFYFKFV